MGKINSFTEGYETVRRQAGLFRAEGWGQIEIGGPDSPAFLQRLLSNEVLKLPVGEGRYNGLLDRKAMTLSLFFLFRAGERDFLAVTPPQLREKTAALLSKMKFIEKVTIRDVSSARGLLQIAGPQAETVLGSLKEIFKTETGLQFWIETTIEVPLVHVSGSREAVDQVAEGLSSRLPLVPNEVLRLLRMRSGFPEYGTDLDESHILLEAALPFTYQRQKGCYPGQEVVERILAYGKGRTPKRLCRLSAKGDVAIPKGSEVWSPDGTKAGQVTSAMHDPLENETVVLGYLDAKFAEGKELELQNGKWVILYPPTPASPPTAS